MSNKMVFGILILFFIIGIVSIGFAVAECGWKTVLLSGEQIGLAYAMGACD
jgi:hypothetical protein